MRLTPFSHPAGSLFYAQRGLIDPLFVHKNQFVSITFSLEIIGPKIYLIFHQILSFHHFVQTFSLIFDPADPLFVLRSFFTSHFDKTLDLIGSMFFIACWTPLLKTLLSVPIPPPGL